MTQTRIEKKPSHDLNADSMMHLCRKAYDKAGPEDRATEAIVATNRNGFTYRFPMVFRCDYL